MTTGSLPIELLAPARDLACGKAAIDCGADPLYLVDETGHRYELSFDCENCAMEIAY